MRKGNVVKLRRKQAVKTDSVATHLKEGRRKKPTTICNIDGDRCIVPKNSESSFLPQSQCQPKSPSRQGVRNVYKNRRRRSQSERDYDHLNLHTIRTRYIYRYLYFTVYGLFIGLSLFCGIFFLLHYQWQSQPQIHYGLFSLTSSIQSWIMDSHYRAVRFDFFLPFFYSGSKGGLSAERNYKDDDNIDISVKNKVKGSTNTSKIASSQFTFLKSQKRNEYMGNVSYQPYRSISESNHDIEKVMGDGDNNNVSADTLFGRPSAAVHTSLSVTSPSTISISLQSEVSREWEMKLMTAMNYASSQEVQDLNKALMLYQSILEEIEEIILSAKISETRSELTSTNDKKMELKNNVNLFFPYEKDQTLIRRVYNDFGLLLSRLRYKEEAIALYQRIIDVYKLSSVELLGNLALLLREEGNILQAISYIEMAYQLDSSDYRILYNLAQMYQHDLFDKKDIALEYYQKCITIEPNLHQAYMGMGNLLGSQGRLEEARKHYNTALSIIENFEQSKGKYEKEQYRQWKDSYRLQIATAVIPQVFFTVSEMIETRRTFEKNLKELLVDPSFKYIPDPITSTGSGSLGYYLIYTGQNDVLIRSYLAQLYWKSCQEKLDYVAPFLLTSTNERASNIEDTYSKNIPHKNQKNIQSPHLLKIGFTSSFFYHHSVGLLLQGVMKNLHHLGFEVYIIPLGPHPSDDPVYCSIVDTVKKDKQAESVNYDQGMGRTTYKRGSIQLIPTPNDLSEQQKIIGSLELDILVFGEVGMDTHTYFLPFSRLARRSVLFWGHAITSGISLKDGLNYFTDEDSHALKRLPKTDFLSGKNFNTTKERDASYRRTDQQREKLEQIIGGIDYFVSSKLFEPLGINAQKKYVEKLYLMEGMTTFFQDPRRSMNKSIDDSFYTREYYGLPSTSTVNMNDILERRGTSNEKKDPPLIVVPQTAYKLHPDFDEILEKILTRNPNAYCIFLEGDIKEYAQRVKDRMKSNIDSRNFERIQFIRRLSHNEYLGLVKLATLILDPFPVGGGRSSFEIFSVGTPIVVLYPKTSILQLTYAMYMTMDKAIGKRIEEVETSSNVLGKSDKYNKDDFLWLSLSESFVAYSIKDYVDIVSSYLSTSDDVQDMVRRTILGRNYLLYENQNVLKEWALFLEGIITLPRPNTLDYEISSLKPPIDEAIDNHYMMQILDQADEKAGELDSTTKSKYGKNDEVKEVIYTVNLSVDSSNVSGQINVFNGENTFMIAKEACDRLDLDQLQCLLVQRILFSGAEMNSISPFSLMTNNIDTALENKDKRTREAVWSVQVQLVNDLKDIRGQHEFTNAQSKGTPINLKIFHGDDFYQKLNWFAYSYQLPDSSKEQLSSNALEVGGLSTKLETPGWIGTRRKKFLQAFWLNYHQEKEQALFFKVKEGGAAWRPNVEVPMDKLDSFLFDNSMSSFSHANNYNSFNPPEKLRQTEKGWLTIAFTTCKRFHLFKQTADSLLLAFRHHEWKYNVSMNDIVKEILVVDDGSSVEDLLQMQVLYPHFTFITKKSTMLDNKLESRKLYTFKGAKKGHAGSMNIIINHAKTKYLLYLEDDWLCLSKNLEFLFDAKTILDESISSSLDQEFVPSSDTDENKLEFISQVLFNDQTSRSCAYAYPQCPLVHSTQNEIDSYIDDAYNLGGSERKIKIRRGPFLSKSFVTYHLHEFASQKPGEDFNYWPGLSLNPGLWNLDKIKHLYSLYSLKYSKSGQVKLKNSKFSSSEINSGKSNHIMMFQEDDRRFEQTWSMETFLMGCNMAYLPQSIFRHLGDGDSAYTRNNLPRDWD